VAHRGDLPTLPPAQARSPLTGAAPPEQAGDSARDLPCVGEFVLSSRSIGVLAEAIEAGNTATTMGTLFLKADVDRWEPQGAANKLDRSVKLLKNLRAENSKETNAGALELARLMLAAGKANPTSYTRSEPTIWWAALRDAVAADGWEFDDNDDRLVPTVPALQVTDEVTWIETDLKDRGWTTAAGHYRQAIEAFASGNWASANSQLRAFFEDLVRHAGGVPPGAGTGQVQQAFDALQAANKLVNGEQQFGKDLWKLLHANGSHPGLSDQDESRFRLLTLTGYARYLLRRV
jgi:hypothetical protein